MSDEEDFSIEDMDDEFTNLFNEHSEMEAEGGNDATGTPDPEPVPADPTTNLVSLIISELECPVCLQPMLGHLQLPLLCPNGHPCCSSCSARVRICPICRSSIIRWTRCLSLERIGSYMVEKGIITQPESSEQQTLEQENLQARRRRRSVRLERARRHLDMWGRTGRSQPGRYWSEVRQETEVLMERLEDALDDSGYYDEEEDFPLLPRLINFEDTENDLDDREIFAFETNTQDIEAIDEQNTSNDETDE